MVTPAQLAELVRAAASDVLARRGLDLAALPADVGVERPRNPEHGDYATNVAMRTAKKAGVPPRDLAGWLVEELAGRPGIASAEVAGPGFINLRLGADAQGAIVGEVLAAGEGYGTGDEYAGRNVNLEFVSANPTGSDAHRRRPVGRGRRRAGPASSHARAPRSSASTTSTTPARRSTGSRSSLVAAAQG